ncbi:hypothetical protein IFM89_010035, partial [Coptis chinensis]
MYEATTRWLWPNEILAILCNTNWFQVQVKPVYLAQSGTIVFYNHKMLRNFRKDGHNWTKKKDGKTVKEAHEYLKGLLLVVGETTLLLAAKNGHVNAVDFLHESLANLSSNDNCGYCVLHFAAKSGLTIGEKVNRKALLLIFRRLMPLNDSFLSRDLLALCKPLRSDGVKGLLALCKHSALVSVKGPFKVYVSVMF